MNGELQMCNDSTYTAIALANLDPQAAGRIEQFVMFRLPLDAAKR
jgi:hypothetical protein